MEIISIERGTYEELLTNFNRFVEEMKRMGSRGTDKRLGEWLDNQDVCRILNISPRTLQTLRDSGVLGYSQFERKVYYKPEDVLAILSLVEQRKKEASLRERFKRKEVNDD
ncbi:MAG: helix-turn-helix domain-containing protein [Prevotella sp.]|nr:helix-turn-helix domain-containing protein [Prevotella sp.]